MPRRGSSITQADVARVIRAAKQEGATAVEVHVGGGATIIIRIAEVPIAPAKMLEEHEDIAL